jgi:hypothetical protein
MRPTPLYETIIVKLVSSTSWRLLAAACRTVKGGRASSRSDVPLDGYERGGRLYWSGEVVRAADDNSEGSSRSGADFPRNLVFG